MITHKKAYKAIIFDVGDTLLANYPSQAKIYTERINSLGFTVDALTAGEISAALEKASHEQLAKEQNGEPRMSDADFEAMLDIAALSCVAKYRDKYKKTGAMIYLEKLKHIPLPKQELKIIPGTFETLAALKDRGFRLAVVSNHRAWLPAHLANIGLADFFEIIIVSDIVGIEKPDVRIMKLALEQLALESAECLYVGDHPFDVLCAKNAGINCAWLTSSESILPDSVPYKEDIRINKLIDLLAYI